MGRAERRIIERANRLEDNKQLVTMTQHELTEMRRKWVGDSINYRVAAMMVCFSWALRIECEFEQSEILRVLECVDNMMGDILEGKTTVEEMHERLKDEVELEITGIDI